MKTNKILQGDALSQLKTLPEKSINMCMTSPPYWALRDYGNATSGIIWGGDKNCEHDWERGFPAGDKRITKRSENRAGWERLSRKEFSKRSVKNVCPICEQEFNGKPNQKFCSTKCLNTLSNKEREEIQQKSNFCKKCKAWKGQLGLEPTFNQYISNLCDIFDEVKRVLRDDGTCWVNIGDTYSATRWTGDGKGQPMNKMKDGHRDINPIKNTGNIPDKCLVGIPFRFALEMINRGWILRNTIIWHKPNCMPSSVKDRFTVDFEYFFFFSKKKKYYFETQLEEIADSTKERGKYHIGDDYNNKGKDNKTVQGLGKLVFRKDNKNKRNKRTVWRICPKPFKEAHFAVYPEELCETPIKAGCPDGGIILDPFFGAGTTGLVALKQNKKFIGIELNPEYIGIANKRLKPLLEQSLLPTTPTTIKDNKKTIAKGRTKIIRWYSDLLDKIVIEEIDEAGNVIKSNIREY